MVQQPFWLQVMDENECQGCGPLTEPLAGPLPDASESMTMKRLLICRGMGRQAQLVLCNIAGFWVIGTLTGWSLAFPAKLGVSGLWIGINAGVFACGEKHVLRGCSDQVPHGRRIIHSMPLGSSCAL